MSRQNSQPAWSVSNHQSYHPPCPGERWSSAHHFLPVSHPGSPAVQPPGYHNQAGSAGSCQSAAAGLELFEDWAMTGWLSGSRLGCAGLVIRSGRQSEQEQSGVGVESCGLGNTPPQYYSGDGDRTRTRLGFQVFIDCNLLNMPFRNIHFLTFIYQVSQNVHRTFLKPSPGGIDWYVLASRLRL